MLFVLGCHLRVHSSVDCMSSTHGYVPIPRRPRVSTLRFNGLDICFLHRLISLASSSPIACLPATQEFVRNEVLKITNGNPLPGFRLCSGLSGLLSGGFFSFAFICDGLYGIWVANTFQTPALPLIFSHPTLPVSASRLDLALTGQPPWSPPFLVRLLFCLVSAIFEMT